VDEELKKVAYLGFEFGCSMTRFPQEYATMQEVTATRVTFPSTSRDLLSEIRREGAQQMLTTAIEAEVAEWVEAHRHIGAEKVSGRLCRKHSVAS
jgi:hypothetical protein